MKNTTTRRRGRPALPPKQAGELLRRIVGEDYRSEILRLESRERDLKAELASCQAELAQRRAERDALVNG
jgi:multidrug resistance efflux pump